MKITAIEQDGQTTTVRFNYTGNLQDYDLDLITLKRGQARGSNGTGFMVGTGPATLNDKPLAVGDEIPLLADSPTAAARGLI